MLWLDTLRPLFAVTATGALVWQVWLLGRRPAARRTRVAWAILACSAAGNALVAAWAALSWRYR